MMSCTGTFRIYFNRMQAAPLVWCVARMKELGGPLFAEFEVAVPAVEISVPVRTQFKPKSTPDADDGRPSAWIEATGRLVIDGKCARVEHYNGIDRQPDLVGYPPSMLPSRWINGPQSCIPECVCTLCGSIVSLKYLDGHVSECRGAPKWVKCDYV